MHTEQALILQMLSWSSSAVWPPSQQKTAYLQRGGISLSPNPAPASSSVLGRRWAESCMQWRPRPFHLGMWVRLAAALPGCRALLSPLGVCRLTPEVLPTQGDLKESPATLACQDLLEPSQSRWASSRRGVPTCPAYGAARDPSSPGQPRSDGCGYAPRIWALWFSPARPQFAFPALPAMLTCLHTILQGARCADSPHCRLPRAQAGACFCSQQTSPVCSFPGEPSCTGR